MGSTEETSGGGTTAVRPREESGRAGDLLREGRERGGVTLEELAESTKIGKRYLEALERGDWGALPGGVFTRGYLRTCAEHLRLDAQAILRAYARELRVSEGETSPTDGPKERELVRAVLTRLGESRSIAHPWSAAGAGWIALGLAIAGLAALTAWIAVRTLAGGPEGPSRARQEIEQMSSAPATQPKAPLEAGLAAAPRRTEGGPPATSSEGAAEPEAPPPPEPELVVPRPVVREPVAAPSVAREPTPTVTTAGSRLEVPECGVGTGVRSHQLTGRGDRFEEGSVVYFWTKVLGGRSGDEIQHVWLHDGRAVSNVELPVGGRHWRTYSRRRLPEGSAGEWKVEARDPEGRVLATRTFTCVPRG